MDKKSIKGKNPFWKGRIFFKEKFIRHINKRNPNIKSIKIIIERKDGMKVEVPLTKYEIFEMSDLGYEEFMHSKEKYGTYSSFWRKIEFIEHDIIGEGSYNIDGKLCKNRHYLYHKPKWKKA